MKLVLASLLAAAAIGPLLAWVFIDGPTALFFLAASAIVCACAAMPVLFSVLTRRTGHERRAPDEATEIRLAPPPTAPRSGDRAPE